MKCPYLHTYKSVTGSWTVTSCAARTTPYIPSLSEVNSYCSTSRSQSCIYGRRFLAFGERPEVDTLEGNIAA